MILGVSALLLVKVQKPQDRAGFVDGEILGQRQRGHIWDGYAWIAVSSFAVQGNWHEPE